MKITLIISDLASGESMRGFLLAQVLKRMQHEVEIVGFQFGEELYVIPPDDIPIYTVAGTTFPSIIAGAKELLEKMDGDIIYALKPRPSSFGIALLKKLFNDTKVILDIDSWEMGYYGGDDWRYRPSIGDIYADLFKRDGALRYLDHPLYIQWLEKRIDQADAITLNNRFMENRLGGNYVPTGQNLELFNPDRYVPEICRERYGLAEYKILIYPGVASPEQGIEDLLFALEQLNKPDLRLVIVADGANASYQDELLEKWGKWLIQLPKFSLEAMPEIIASAHLVVIPLRDTLTSIAQFPLEITQAMAMAKPILATRVGDVPEILADTGHLVAPDSPQQLAASIQQIFDNLEAANEQGKTARERCVKCYSFKRMEEILKQVIDNLP
jgi:glycosyltransferase involved in cell wall biosynthesis